MEAEQIKAYCLSKWKAYEEHPFGDIPVCYKLNRKIFAQLYPVADDYKITLKCTADTGQFYRQVYPGTVVRGYHCPPVQQPYWNTVNLNGFSNEELLNMIDHAYDTVLHSFSRKVQKEIMTVDEILIRPMRKEEYPLLEDFLYDAIYQPIESELLPREVIDRPELAIYINDFGQQTDACLVAESKGFLLGAVWCRILTEGIKGYGNIDRDTPELAISVKKEFRGQGIGTSLMKEMISLLRNKHVKKVSLSVSRENYAYQMYCNLGFQVENVQESDCLMTLEIK